MGAFSRQRDLFPLSGLGPEGLLPKVKASEFDISRKVLRRLQRAGHKSSLVDECRAALNALNGSSSAVPSAGSSPSLGHQAVDARLQESVRLIGAPPEDLDPAGAFAELRGTAAYHEDGARMASFDDAPVSLPAAGSTTVPLADLYGSGGADFVEDFISSRVLSSEAAQSKLTDAGLKKPYLDPVLKSSPKLYSQFIRDLHKRDMVDFDFSVVESAGLFFVTKKSGSLRLVIDARRSNCWFSAPDSVALATGQAFGDLEFSSDDPVYIGQVDIKDAFYHFELPESLRCYFGLPSVRAGDVGVTAIGGRPVHPLTRIYPRMKALPMGWSHALWFCQVLHRRIIEDVAGLTNENYICDRKLHVNDGKLRHTVYVDNFVAIGTDKAEVARVVLEVEAALRKRGLPTHDLVEGALRSDVLGWHIDGTTRRLSPSQRRVWRLRLAIEHFLSLRVCSPADLEKIVGHCTFVALVRRESLSVFQHVYTFINKFRGLGAQPWWDSIRWELTVFKGILPVLWRDLGASWHPTVSCFDASPWGLGCVDAKFDIDDVAAAGRLNERWRTSRDDAGFSLRDRALLSLGLESEKAVKGDTVRVIAGNSTSRSSCPSVFVPHCPVCPMSSCPMEPECHAPVSSCPDVSCVGAVAPGAWPSHQSGLPEDDPCEQAYVCVGDREKEYLRTMLVLMDNPQWKLVCSAPWDQFNNIVNGEARAATFTVKHVLRSVSSFGKHVVILSDSLTSVLGITKGRSSKLALLRSVRSVAAHCLATGTSVHWRWLPSEANPGDAPSRGRAQRPLVRKFSELAARCFGGGVAGRAAAARAAGCDPPDPEAREVADHLVDPGLLDLSEPLWVVPSDGLASFAADQARHSGLEGAGGGGAGADGLRGEVPWWWAGSGGGAHDRCAPAAECGSVQARCGAQGRGSECSAGGRPGGRCQHPPRRGVAAQDVGVVSDASRHAEALVRAERAAFRARAFARRKRGGVDAGAVPRRRAGACGGSDDVSTRRPLAPSRPSSRRLADACVAPGPAGVVAPIAAADPPAGGSGGCSVDRSLAGGCGALGDGPAVHAVRGSLLAPIGALPPAGAPCSSSDAGSGADVSPLVLRPEPSGRRCEHAKQDRRVRRIADPRRGSGHKACSGGGAPGSRATRRRAALRFQSARLLAGGGGCGEGAEAGESPGAVPVQAHRGECRLCVEEADLGRDQASRPVAVRRQCEALREGGAAGRAAAASPPPAPARRRPQSGPHPRAAMRALGSSGSPGRPLRVRVFLDIFCGKGGVGRAMSRRGFLVLRWDIRLGEAYDLTRVPMQRLVRGWLLGGLVAAWHAGFPCSSFSRARESGGGPPPLRSNDWPCGLPGLSDVDRMKVAIGNNLLNFSATLMHISIRLGIPGTAENPMTSRAWRMPRMIALLKRRHVSQGICDFCQFGTPWRKSTTFVGCFVDFFPLEIRCRRVYGLEGEVICSRSGRPHVELAGKDEDGDFRTKVAEPYPSKLCTILAAVLADAVIAKRVATISALLLENA